MRQSLQQPEPESPYLPRVTAGFRDLNRDSMMGNEIPDELDCKCEGGGSTSNFGSGARDHGIKPTQFIVQKHAKFVFEDRDNNLSESDAYSPYGIVDESFLRSNTEKSNIQNESTKIHEHDLSGGRKTNELEGGFKNIESAGTGHETLSQRERSLQTPYETPGQGLETAAGTGMQ